VFEAFFPPSAYSLIPDYFPPSYRARANAILALGTVLGNGLASISTLIINSVGWRRTYFLVGALGVLFGVLVLLFVKDPERGRFDPKKQQLPQQSASKSQQIAQPSACASLFIGFNALVSNKCGRWCMLGGLCRYWQAYTMIYFSISYFAFYKMPVQYGLWNAFSVSVGGFSSSMIAGIISDKFEKRNYMTKAYVAVVMSVNSVFTSMVLFLFTRSFAFSMTFVFLNSLLCEGWAPPVMTMIQTVIPVEKKAAAIGAFKFSNTMSGTFASIVVGMLISSLNINPDVSQDQQKLGFVLAANSMVPSFFAALCFYRAGTYYTPQKV
jgi:predicted MFS family arabinose efflux permease